MFLIILNLFLIVGNDLTISAGIRFDFYNTTVKLTDEIVAILIRSSKTEDVSIYGNDE